MVINLSQPFPLMFFYDMTYISLLSFFRLFVIVLLPTSDIHFSQYLLSVLQYTVAHFHVSPSRLNIIIFKNVTTNRHFGGVFRNNLSNIVDLSNDDDQEFNLPVESQYIDPQILHELLKYKTCFTVFSVNIQSLNAKSNLNENGFLFSNIENGFSLLSIPHYTTIPLPSSVSKHG